MIEIDKVNKKESIILFQIIFIVESVYFYPIITSKHSKKYSKLQLLRF